MVTKAVQVMLNTAVAGKEKAVKNVALVNAKGDKKVRLAQSKADKASYNATAKITAAEEGISLTVEKISTMSDALKKKAAKLDAIIASVKK